MLMIYITAPSGEGCPTTVLTVPDEREPLDQHRGTSVSWVEGDMSYNLVTFPNGEIRAHVDMYNGYLPDSPMGRKFGCAWSPVMWLTVYPDGRAPKIQRHWG